MAGDVVFGAVAQLKADMAKAQTQAQIAQLQFQSKLQAEQARQETEKAKLKAEMSAEAAAAKGGGQAQAQQPEPLDLAAMFREQPLGQGQSAPVTISDAIAQSSDPVRGGAAVQSMLKGGQGGPDTTGAPSTITTQRDSTDFVRSQGYGTVFDPVVRSERTTEQNALTAAQAGQLNQAQQQFEIQRQDRKDEQRATLTLQVADKEGITPASASKAVGALQRGDTQGFFDAMGGVISKANSVRDMQRDQQTRLINAQIEASNANAEQSRASAASLRALAVKRANDSSALTIDVLGGWSNPGGKALSQEGVLTAQSKYTDEDGDFKPEGQAALEEVQRSTLRATNRAYVLVGEGGSFSRSKFETIDATPMVAAAQVLSSARASGAEKAAAEKLLRNVKDTDGNRLFKVKDGALTAARAENHQLLETILTAGQRRELLQQGAGAPLPTGALEVELAPEPVQPAAAPTPVSPARASGQKLGSTIRNAFRDNPEESEAVRSGTVASPDEAEARYAAGAPARKAASDRVAGFLAGLMRDVEAAQQEK